MSQPILNNVSGLNQTSISNILIALLSNTAVDYSSYEEYSGNQSPLPTSNSEIDLVALQDQVDADSIAIITLQEQVNAISITSLQEQVNVDTTAITTLQEQVNAFIFSSNSQIVGSSMAITTPGLYVINAGSITLTVAAPSLIGEIIFKDITGLSNPNVTISGNIDSNTSGTVITNAYESLTINWIESINTWVQL